MQRTPFKPVMSSSGTISQPFPAPAWPNAAVIAPPFLQPQAGDFRPPPPTTTLIPDNWIGGSGGTYQWYSGNNWSDGDPPTDYSNTTINVTAATLIQNSVDEGWTAALTMSSFATVEIQNDSFVIGNTMVGATAFFNAGTFILDAVNSGRNDLLIGSPNIGDTGATVTLSGGGTIVLGNSALCGITGSAGTDILDNEGNTILGAGQFGTGSLTYINGATAIVNANDSVALTVNTGATAIVNSGLMEATGSGGLVLQTVIDDTSTGTVSANGGNVYLQGGTMQGGTLASSGSGAWIVQSNATGTLDGTAGAITNAGNLDISPGGTLSVRGTLINTGAITLSTTNAATTLLVDSPTLTLSGGGTLTMTQSSGTTNGNTITAAASSYVLDNVNSTIQGGGNLGNGTLSLTNGGTIDAFGYALILNTGTNTVTNTGLIESTRGGVLIVAGTRIDSSAGGTISGAGGTVYLQGGTLAGGTITSTTGGAIAVAGGQTGTLDGSASAVTNTGIIDVDAGGTLALLGSIANQGTIALQTNNPITDLVIAGKLVTLSGAGTVTMVQSSGTTSGNTIIGAAASDELYNASTIAGGGNLGAGTLTLVNAGTIDAFGYALVINTGANTVTNAGLIEATGGSGLVVQATRIDSSSGGTISATGGNVYLQGGTLAGGLLTSTGSSAVVVQTGNTGTLDGSAHALTSSATIDINAGGTLSLAGSIVNQGTIALQSTNATTELVIGSPLVTLSGAGTVTMYQTSGGTSGNFIIGAAATDELDNLSTIAGGGNLGGGTLTLVNGGTIDANSGYALVLNTGAIAATNTGLLESTGSGGLVLQTAVSNAGGTISAAGGNVYFSGGTISGGLITSSGAGAFTVQASQTGTLNGAANSVTNNGSIAIQPGGTLDLLGGIVNNGNISLSSYNPITRLIIGSTTVTLSGGGTITLSQTSGATIGNILVGAAAGDTLDNAGNTIAGGGLLGDGTLTLINSGIIDANSGYGLQLNTGSTGTNLAGGQWISTGSGGLTIENGAYTNFGLIQADDGSAVTFQTGATLTNSANGTLTGGTYGAVASGHGATLSVTGSAVTVDAASLILSGAGATILFGGTAIDASLSSIAATGTLSVLNGRNFTATANGGAFTDNGALNLAGGIWADNNLTIASGANVAGFGTMNGAVLDNGTVTASGGTLVLSGVLSGAGTFSAAAGAALELTGGGTLAQNFAGAGTLVLGAGGYVLGSPAPKIAAIGVAAGASLSGTGTLTSALIDSGTVLATNLTLTEKGALSGNGTVSASAGAVFDITGGGTFTGTMAGPGTVRIDAALTLNSGAALAAASVIDTANLTLGAGESLSNASGNTLTLTSGGTGDPHRAEIQITGGAGDALGNAGTLTANGLGTEAIATAFVNTGTVQALAGTLSFLGAVTNNGVIDASSGLATFKTAVGGTGTLDIGATGTLSLLKGAVAGQAVDFLATAGLLDLTKPTSFDGTITGFGGSDAIDLLKTAESSLSFANNVLTVKDGNKTVASLHFSGGYTQSDFVAQSDGHGGTFIYFV